MNRYASGLKVIVVIVAHCRRLSALVARVDEPSPFESNFAHLQRSSATGRQLSKLSKAATVYRGISGGQLPLALIRENDDGIKGGVEVGFMSTSTERHVAEQYSGAKTDDGKLSIIIEMQQGMVRRTLPHLLLLAPSAADCAMPIV